MSSNNSVDQGPITDCVEVTITVSDAEWLSQFTRSLLAEHLAACAQQWETPIRSMYWWNGEIQQATEARVALHTRADLVPTIVARARSEHPYDVACIIATPLIAGNPAYLHWIHTETS